MSEDDYKDPMKPQSHWPPQASWTPEVDRPTEPPPSVRGRHDAFEKFLECARRVEEAALRANFEGTYTTELESEMATMNKARVILERAMGPVVHYLKTDPEPFNAMKRGLKLCEVRKFDRDFRVGDVLVLSAFDRSPATLGYTGEKLRMQVTHIVPPGSYGLPKDVGVMSVEPV